MNIAALRQQIERWLDRLSPEHLALVASFIEFLSQKQRQGVIISPNYFAEIFSAEIQEMSASNSFSIPEDIQPVIEQLEQGELPGDRITGVGYAVFKLRVRNNDT